MSNPSPCIGIAGVKKNRNGTTKAASPCLTLSTELRIGSDGAIAAPAWAGSATGGVIARMTA
jgi:hypothetical protein